MANSLKKQTQGDAMNLPPGIDRLTLEDGTPRYRVRIRISGHKPISKSFKNLTHAKQWKRTPVLIFYPGCGFVFDLFEVNSIICSRVAFFSGIKIILVQFRHRIDCGIRFTPEIYG
jgi:hypothetical protein